MSTSCIFCEIANGRIPSIRIHEDADFIAFLDINPITRGHLLIITREHYPNTLDVPDTLLAKALPLAKRLAAAALAGVGAESFNILVNNGTASGQAVGHWHLHVIPRKTRSEFPFKEGGPADLTQLPFTAADIRSHL
ncbi:MAG: HIT domain-containing protein [Deltaproteobacteria bacterium]|jgi:histidine triad (HIT) family protein|nr:HIT domain-containing protein [Deltaproteobacteria bacterium]